MRIAYLAQIYPPMISGQAVATQRLAAGMAARGHSVLVIAASERGRPYLEEQANLRVLRLRSFQNPFQMGQSIMLWPWQQLYAELLRFQPDIVHVHDPLHSAIAGIYANRGREVQMVMTSHQLPWFVSRFIPVPTSLQKMVDRALWRYADWLCRQFHIVIAPTQTIAEVIREHTGHVPYTISNGMDLEAFHPQPAAPDEHQTLCAKYGLDPRLPIILHVGQLNVQKRVDMVVRAVAQVMQNTNAQLLVIGDGKQRKALIRLAHRLGIHRRSVFAGYVSTADDLSAIYRLASVFVTASEIETQGLVLLEAMASGLPVVAVRATCIPEIVHDGINGYLAPIKDVNTLALRIEQVLRNPRDMGKAARAIAQGHTFAATLRKHEALYTGLLEDRSTASHLDKHHRTMMGEPLMPVIQAERSKAVG
jgi:glycosyltransferase involved in cell wall biosynthesis